VPKFTFTVKEAAFALGISPSRVWELIKDGKLESGKLAGRTVIKLEALRAYIEREYQSSPPKPAH
jgi:excisionase family DNA binding protein